MSILLRSFIKSSKALTPFPQLVKHLATNQFLKSDLKYIISGPPLNPIVGVTIPEFVFETISKHENASAFTCGLTRRTYTFKQVRDLSHNFAAALMQNGLKPGATVGVMLPNLPETSIVTLGIWLAGGVVSPISSTFTADEVSRQCKIADVNFVVTMPFFLPVFQQLKIKSIINVGENVEGAHSFFEMIKTSPVGVEFTKGSKVDTVNDLAMLPFSSGTTGPPKAVMLTHSNICSNADQCFQPGVINIGAEERYIGLLPFYHCFGFSALVLGPIRNGVHVCTLPNFDPMTFVSAIRDHKPTTLHVVTPLIQYMSMSPEFKKTEFHSIHTIISGAAPVGKRLIQKFLQKAEKEIFFQEGYGMTECTTVSHVSRPKRQNTKTGSIGEVIPGTKCIIVDVETGETLSENKPGELWLSGPQIMKGYYKNPESTAETMSEEWLKTGDVCSYDQDKCFYVVDRMKELIKVKGLQVSPSELEDLLRTHTDVLDVAVIGVKDEKLGEAPKAFIVRKNPKLTPNHIHDFLERKIAPHKKLAGGVEFIEEIPRANSGKILRRLILANDLTGSHKKG